MSNETKKPLSVELLKVERDPVTGYLMYWFHLDGVEQKSDFEFKDEVFVIWRSDDGLVAEITHPDDTVIPSGAELVRAIINSIKDFDFNFEDGILENIPAVGMPKETLPVDMLVKPDATTDTGFVDLKTVMTTPPAYPVAEFIGAEYNYGTEQTAYWFQVTGLPEAIDMNGTYAVVESDGRQSIIDDAGDYVAYTENEILKPLLVVTNEMREAAAES